MKISKKLVDVVSGQMITAELKNSAVGKVQNQLIVRHVNRDWVLFDLTTNKVVAQTYVKELLVQRYLMEHSDVLRVWSNKQ